MPVCLDVTDCGECVTLECLWAEVGAGNVVCVPARLPYLLNTNVSRVVETLADCAVSLLSAATSATTNNSVEAGEIPSCSEGGSVGVFFGGKKLLQLSPP